ncbi:hypothetical protein WCT98_03200 [Pectobacterium brasiliense]
MDAAKVAAASDKNVKDVFEQHKCWPVGRVPFIGRVFASATVRQVTNFPKEPRSGVISREKASGHGAAATERPVSCVCYDVA